MGRRRAKSKRTVTPPPAAYDKKKMFGFFWATVRNIRRDWDAVSCLFGDPKRREFLQKSFPAFADSIGTHLTISVYMGLAQLFDPPESFGDPNKRNLVLRRVIDDVAPPIGSPERTQIENDYKAMEPLVKRLKDWRNAVGAHRSLNTTLALMDYIENGHSTAHPLPHIPLMELHATLERLIGITDDLVKQVQGKFEPWYEPEVVREVDRLFAFVKL